jgi:folate-binding protein YgfZ
VVVARLRRFLLRTAAVVEPAASVGSGPVEEVARVRAGWPAFGHEYGGVHSGEVIPAELGRWLVDEAVCFTKVCYVGQELTTRIESRGGNVPRRMRVFELATELTAAPGDRIVAVGDQGAAPVGTITSAVVDPATGITVVMGLVARRVAGDATLSVQPGSGM